MPGTAFPEGQEPDDVTNGDSIGDAIRHELDTLFGAEPLADPVRGWQSGGGATGRVPFGSAKSQIYEPPKDTMRHAADTHKVVEEGPDGRLVVNEYARVQKWADVAMWKAPEHVDPQ